MNTIMCLSIGTPKNNSFSICSKWKINCFRCPKMWAHYSLLIRCLNIGFPRNYHFAFEINGKVVVLSVPILKHFKVLPCILKSLKCKVAYRIYPKYLDTVNVRTPSFFLKRHLFYVPYISGHVPNSIFLLSVNVWTPKPCPLFLIKLLFFTTGIFCIFALFTCVSGKCDS